MTGLVLFRLGDREYATALAGVREVVRLTGLADLPGMTPPLAGVIDVRGEALPVMDLRTGPREARGDVLVVRRDHPADPADPGPGGVGIGIAVDRVHAVTELGAPGSPAARGGTAPPMADVLPAYVLEVLRGPGGPVFLVDLIAMLAAAGPAPGAG